MNPAVVEALDCGACIVTATRRLAYELISAYDAQQLHRGKTVWQTAAVYPWDSWMQKLWRDTCVYSAQVCLGNAQLQQLLGDIIETDLLRYDTTADSAPAALWNIPQSARSALDAWQLCHQWQISYAALQQEAHVDHARFGRWAGKLYAQLKSKNWISPAQIPESLIEAEFRPDQNAVLFGFDGITTQQQRFIEYYRSQGSRFEQINSQQAPAAQLKRYVFESPREEWQQIGAWAREKLLQKPDSRIGIITPNVADIRQLAENSLREQLIPDYFLGDTADPFHFSKGGELSQESLVSSALDCLGLLVQIEFSQLSTVFLSPYWGSDSEQALRAQLAIDLRRKLAYHFDLFELIEWLKGWLTDPRRKTHGGDKLLKKLSDLQAIKTDARGTHRISNWRQTFTTCLQTLGWPGTELDSAEYQAQQAWEHCLDKWVTLEAVCPAMSLAQALQSLRSFCRESVFQARAQSRAPVQVMGVLEAAELDFDAVWLAGFDEQAWPVIASANPFIPIRKQIEAGVPEAIPDQRATLAQTKTAQLCALCDDINFSHARIQGDLEPGISVLMPDIECSGHTGLAKVFALDDAIRTRTPVLYIRPDDIGLPYRAEDARGGTGLIQKQSACPFSAYAHYRLRAAEDDEPDIGIDSMERGSLLHRTLESIWDELEDSATLYQHIEKDCLHELISAHCAVQLKRAARHSGLGEGYFAAEKQRLSALLMEWLLLEAQRPTFQVSATEQKLKHSINGLRLHFILDRVDQLSKTNAGEDGQNSRLIMDYKSGRCELRNWTGDRPEQPQIPLYYLALKNTNPSSQVDALSFAQIKSGECEFVGISRFPATLPGVKSLDETSASTSLKKDFSGWDALYPGWQRRIEQLVKNFQAGIAHVDPKTSGSCNYCHFGPICRIHTRRQMEQDVTD